MLSLAVPDSIICVKQLLLRVPDDLHQRLTALAADSGRSVNALATTILSEAAGEQAGSRRARLRARAAALNVQAAPATASGAPDASAPSLPAVARSAAIESTRGLGPLLDAIVDEDRDRR